jgi:hypothetical protein
LHQIADGWIAPVQVAKARAALGREFQNLIHRNAPWQQSATLPGAATRAVVRRYRVVPGRAGGEELMTAAEQAFLLTGELFVASFLAIAAFWFADKLRRSLTGKS